MTFLWMFVGAVLGGWLSWIVFDESVGAVGMAFGIVCGLLFGRLARLGKRVGELEAQLKMLVSAPAVPRPETPAVAPTPTAQTAPVETAAAPSATTPAQTVFASTAAGTGPGTTTIDL